MDSERMLKELDVAVTVCDAEGIILGPWHDDNVYKGFVELSIVMPDTMPHHVRE